MVKRATFGLGVAALALLANAASCGARSELEAPFGPSDRPREEGGGPPDRPECVVFNSSAQLAAFDLFMMLDTSGSMQQFTPGGQSKWEAVQFALSSFFFDPESTGIGVQLDSFPKLDRDHATFCFDVDDCGGAALAPAGCNPQRVCELSGGFCFSDQDCENQGAPGDNCVPFGRCVQEEPPNPEQTNGYVPCIPSNPNFGCNVGPCVPTGTCDDRNTCESGAYQALPQEIKRLPEARDALNMELDDIIPLGEQPVGGTPTLPALRGVMDAALAWQASNPDTRIGVLLATDGFPSACDPDLYVDPDQTVPNLAAVAADGFGAGIRTFVIGVFQGSEESWAQARLDQIAAAGGTGQSFVVTTEQDVANSFRAALNQIRVDAKACAFAVTDDEPIDFGAVWVKLQRGSEEIWLRRVSGADECEDANGGFYFDPPPLPNATTANIVLCPSSCDVLGASANRRAEVFTECSDDPTQP